MQEAHREYYAKRSPRHSRGSRGVGPGLYGTRCSSTRSFEGWARLFAQRRQRRQRTRANRSRPTAPQAVRDTPALDGQHLHGIRGVLAAPVTYRPLPAVQGIPSSCVRMCRHPSGRAGKEDGVSQRAGPKGMRAMVERAGKQRICQSAYLRHKEGPAPRSAVLIDVGRPDGGPANPAPSGKERGSSRLDAEGSLRVAHGPGIGYSAHVRAQRIGPRRPGGGIWPRHGPE